MTVRVFSWSERVCGDYMGFVFHLLIFFFFFIIILVIIIFQFYINRQTSLVDGLVKSIKKGDASEKILASSALSLISIHLGLQLDGVMELITMLSTLVADSVSEHRLYCIIYI